MIDLDQDWLAAHPLPRHESGDDKDDRGRVLLVGGAAFVPGALRLTGEAALRAGAGKLQMATVEPVAIPLGVLVPEAAMIALPADENGEIDAGAVSRLEQPLGRCGALIVGPGMSGGDGARTLLEHLLTNPRDDLSVLLDAAAIACVPALEQRVRAFAGRIVLTPHPGEMAALTGLDVERIAAAPEQAARDAATRFGATIALKGGETIVAAPNGTTLRYAGGGVGLATGGSGDVLAGMIGGLLARGADPLVATAWGVWLHGEAGALLAERIGPLGFLARELLPSIPMLMRSVKERGPLGFG